MSFGDNPADSPSANQRYDRLSAQADADRARRLAGHRPLLQRLLERLRPHREEPGSDPQNFSGTPNDPGD
jgi:hypothetical protein